MKSLIPLTIEIGERKKTGANLEVVMESSGQIWVLLS